MPVRRGPKRGRSVNVVEGDQRDDTSSFGGVEPARSVSTTTAKEDESAAEDYSSMEYWDKRYRDGVCVEWYCGFEHVRPLFERFIPKDSRVLDVGCGDKPLAYNLRDAGYTGNICSFDFSATVIEQLRAEKARNERTRLDDGVEFRVLDARKLPFEAGSFDLVVDKGTVDAMLCDGRGSDNARATCREAARVLASGGWFVIVSHIHPATTEGVELMAEALIPGLRDSTPAGESYSWSLDVHCVGISGGESSAQEEEEHEEEHEEDEEEHEEEDEQEKEDQGQTRREDNGEDSSSLGPSAYLVRKVARRLTRSLGRAGQQQQAEVPIRLHEY